MGGWGLSLLSPDSLRYVKSIKRTHGGAARIIGVNPVKRDSAAVIQKARQKEQFNRVCIQPGKAGIAAVRKRSKMLAYFSM